MRRTLGERVLRGAPEGPDDEGVAIGNHRDQIGGRLLGSGAALKQDLCGAAIKPHALAHVDVLEYGAADDRVPERERVLLFQEVGLDE